MREKLKEIVRVFSGVVIPAVLSDAKRDRLLTTWQTPSDRSYIGWFAFRIVFDHWIRTIYLAEADPETRESLKDICMTGKSGVAWAAEYDGRPLDRGQRYFELSFEEANPHFCALENLLEQARPGHLVVQVGCSSGREMAYFAGKFPLIAFLGTDIDRDIIARATQIHKLDNLRFEVMRAHEIPQLISRSGTVTIFSSGSLQYVQPEHLEKMFQGLARRGAADIVLLEPTSVLGRTFRGHPYTRWRGNFSFSHEYELFAKESGFETITKAKIQFTHCNSSPHFNTRHYFYFGKGR
jgi:hypothetical protein